MKTIKATGISVSHTDNRTSQSKPKELSKPLSHSSAFTLSLFENPLNNLDLRGSAKTHGGQSYDVIRSHRAARLPVSFEQTQRYLR